MGSTIALGFLLTIFLVGAMTQDTGNAGGVKDPLVVMVAKLSLNIDQLHRDIAQLKQENNNYRQQVTVLQKQDSDIRGELAKQIGSLRGETGALRGKVAAQTAASNTKDQELESKINDLTAQDKSIMNEVQKLAERANSVQAFSAGLKRIRYGHLSGVIVYDKVNYMHGYGYSSSTGRFTAPVEGLYSFTLVAASDCGDCSAEIDMSTTTETMGRLIISTDSADQSSFSTVWKLKKGEQVYTKKAYGAAGLREWPFTTFSGFLIKAL